MNKYDFVKLCIRIAKKEKIDFDNIEVDRNTCFFYHNEKITDYFILSTQENRFIPFYKKYKIEWTCIEYNKVTCDYDNALKCIYGISDKNRLYKLNEYF